MNQANLITPDEIKRAKALDEKANKGPWTPEKVIDRAWLLTRKHDGEQHHAEANCKYVAHARTILPKAVSTLEEAARLLRESYYCAPCGAKPGAQCERCDRLRAVLAAVDGKWE